MSDKTPQKKVLVIEDMEGIRKFSCHVVELEGYEALEAATGEQGMELVREHKCALLLLDMGLPGRDGWSVLEEVNGDGALKEIPMVVFSTTADEVQRRRALDMGAADYIVKPAGVATLRETINRVVGE
ncbi:MAG: response regulator [Dehalococcoidia bacterium]|nr:response regulator [Dehalococcoidia bacterium]